MAPGLDAFDVLLEVVLSLVRVGGILFSACPKFRNSEIPSFCQQIRFCIITSIPFVRF